MSGFNTPGTDGQPPTEPPLPDPIHTGPPLPDGTPLPDDQPVEPQPDPYVAPVLDMSMGTAAPAPPGVGAVTPVVEVPVPPMAVPAPTDAPAAVVGAPQGTASGNKRAGRGRHWWLWPVGTAAGVAILAVGGYFGLHWAVDKAATDERESYLTERSQEAADDVASRAELVNARLSLLGDDGPVGMAAHYLALISAGSVEEALAATGEEASPLTTDAVYATLGLSAMSSPWVSAAEVSGDTASMEVAFTVGGEVGTGRVSAASSGGSWALSSGVEQVASITVDRSGVISVNGVDITAALAGQEDGSLAGELGVLPGIYTVTYADPEGFLAAPEQQLNTTAENLSVSLSTGLSQERRDALQAWAQEQANAWTDQCKNSTLRGDTCGAEVREEGEYLRGKAWTAITIDEYPVIELSATDDPFVFEYGTTGAKYHTSGWSTESSEGVIDRWSVRDYYSGTVTLNKDGTMGITRDFVE